MTVETIATPKLAGCQDMAEKWWLCCEAAPGQFPGELGITGETSNCTVFSLFMPDKRVICSQTPSEGKPAECWLEVEVISKQGDLVVVRLPRQTLENGQFVIVKGNQLQREPGLQKA
jgi:hypothetical protein